MSDELYSRSRLKHLIFSIVLSPAVVYVLPDLGWGVKVLMVVIGLLNRIRNRPPALGTRQAQDRQKKHSNPVLYRHLNLLDFGCTGNIEFHTS